MTMDNLRLAAMFLLLALAACGSGAPSTTYDVAGAAPVVNLPPEERLVAAIESQNCVLTASNVESILLQANLTQDQLVEITPQLAAAGRAEVAATGTIRVLTDKCI
jgi:hypothetical protein